MKSLTKPIGLKMAMVFFILWVIQYALDGVTTRHSIDMNLAHLVAVRLVLIAYRNIILMKSQFEAKWHDVANQRVVKYCYFARANGHRLSLMSYRDCRPQFTKLSINMEGDSVNDIK
jgi:hypothetical protein